MENKISINDSVELLSKGMKHCTKCNNVKPLSDFYLDNTRRGGITGRRCYCIKCDRKILRTYLSNKEDKLYQEKINSEWYQNYLKKKAEGPNSHLNSNKTNLFKKIKKDRRDTYLKYKI